MTNEQEASLDRLRSKWDRSSKIVDRQGNWITAYVEDLATVADVILQDGGPSRCYLQEEDPPEDHDVTRYSAVCGRCYSALDDMHKATIARLESALSDAWTDIGQWMQLAERQREVMPNPDHQPACPSRAGIERSREVREQITKSLQFAKRR